MRRRCIVAILAFLAIPVLAYREHQADLRNREARQFIDTLIPQLHRYKAEHGRYPAAVPSAWYGGRSFPELLRPDFYLTFDHRQEFLMRFQDPRSDPRFWFNDIVAYQSDIGHWSQWDGY